MPINPFLLPMEPLIFTFCFTIEGYNVYVIMKFFPHIDVMMVESTINSPKRDTQGPLGVNTFLNLFNHRLLENLFFLHYQNRTTNVLIKNCEVFLLGFCCCFRHVQPYFLFG